MEKMILIDGSSVLSSHYYGSLPDEIKKEKDETKKETLYEKIPQLDGKYVNALRSMLQALKNLFKEQNYTYCAICFDDSRTTFRNLIYSDYKGTRKKTPEPLKQQMKVMKAILKGLNIPVFSSSEYEADDLIASLSENFKNLESLKIDILTKDRDFLQLIDKTHNVNVFLMQTSETKFQDLRKKYSECEYLSSQKALEFNFENHFTEFSYYPCQVPDIKGLSGDTSDNIPGIYGISANTATCLINKHSNIESLFDSLLIEDKQILENDWKFHGIKRSPYNLLTKNLEETKKIALMCKELATMKRNIPMTLTLENLKICLNYEQINKLISKMYQK